MRKYMTVQGDMWDGIAKKVYGDESYMNVLLEANKNLTDVSVFGPDVVVRVPDVTIPATVLTPPWKR
ncbi:tail protein X [uncultured Acidaminococcus sp.]|uniref:tail protein X n=1 Tax=uncultured Acidaminococcus sp. TaxID=352152 RepID=UPI0026DC5287|nr:tail protein X [uncultured Acidaminococcus sp.]